MDIAKFLVAIDYTQTTTGKIYTEVIVIGYASRALRSTYLPRLGVVFIHTARQIMIDDLLGKFQEVEQCKQSVRGIVTARNRIRLRNTPC